MTNQQLLDFIRQQLQAGATKEKISTDLLANGWNTQDIKEGFDAIGDVNQVLIPTPVLSSIINNPSNQENRQVTDATKEKIVEKEVTQMPPIQGVKSISTPPLSDIIPPTQTAQTAKTGRGFFFRNMFLFMIILLSLIAIGVSVYYFRDSLTKLPIINNFFPDENAIVPDSNITEKTDVAQMPSTSNQNDAPQVCDNYQCLISAATQCQPIVVNISFSGVQFPFEIIPGLYMSGQEKYEIKTATEENKCILIFSYPVPNTFNVSDEGRKTALEGGMTDAQIEDQLKTMNDNSKMNTKKQTTCMGSTDAIVSYLTELEKNKKDGNFEIDVGFDFNGHINYDTSSGQTLSCTDTSPRQPINTSTITSAACSSKNGIPTAVTEEGTSCLSNQLDLGKIVGVLKINDKYPQCCVSK